MKDLLPIEIQKQLDKLGGKSRKDDLVGAAVALLKWRGLSLPELANYLGRNAEYVRNTYLTELIRAEIVEPTIPDNPTDPNQKYRAVRMKSYGEDNE